MPLRRNENGCANKVGARKVRGKFNDKRPEQRRWVKAPLESRRPRGGKEAAVTVRDDKGRGKGACVSVSINA